MAESASRLLVAADSYCDYLGGLYLVRYQAPESHEAALAKVRTASEAMYLSLMSMADLASRDCFGMGASTLSTSEERKNLPVEERRWVDEKLAAFAVEAVDLAYYRYGLRIRQLGIFSLYEEFLRPCPIKRPSHMYLLRRARADRLKLKVLTQDLHDPSYAEYEETYLSQLRKENQDSSPEE